MDNDTRKKLEKLYEYIDDLCSSPIGYETMKELLIIKEELEKILNLTK